MLNINEMKITDIQFFDHTHPVQSSDDDFEMVREYSANIILNDCVVIQLSGNDEETHKVSIPSSAECYWNDEKAQEFALENFDLDEVQKLIDDSDVENNFDFLKDYQTH